MASSSFLDSSLPVGVNLNLVVINCAINSTLQDVKVRPGSGVYAYVDSDDHQSVAGSRYIVWRTFDDVLELQEYSLNRDLHGSELKIQFKNTLLLENGVSIHETTDRVYILVTTLVSAHRLVFRHPSKLILKPKAFPQTTLTSARATPDTSGFSIFHQDFVDDFDHPGNYVQLPIASQSTILGPSSVSYSSCCSWVNTSLDAYYGVSTGLGTLHVIKLPPLHLLDAAMAAGSDGLLAKIQTFDFKQNSLINKFITGFVPSMLKSSPLTSASAGVIETAISLFPLSTLDDELIFALCRDSRIRVLSLKKQEVILVYNLFDEFSGNSLGTTSDNSAQPVAQNVISMRCWHMDENGEDSMEGASVSITNIIVYWSYPGGKVFTLLRINLSDARSNSSAINSSFMSQMRPPIISGQPNLKRLVDIQAPGVEFELLDYFIADHQLWALWQFNDNVSLQYFSLGPNEDGDQPLVSEWVVVIDDATAPPQMSLKSSIVNAQEYYINEIFWRGQFSLATIGKAICVLNRWGEQKLAEAKIDTLIAEAIKFVDGSIRNQMENVEELSVEEYTRMQLDAWHQLYLFCLEYYFSETKPMSIFVDHKTGVKGIVRRGTLEIVPQLAPLDDLIGQYLLLCNQPKDDELETNSARWSNGDPINSSANLFSDVALRNRLSTLMIPIQTSVQGIFPSSLENSIYHLLEGMAAVNRALQEDDLVNFEALMRRMLNFSVKVNWSLEELAKEIIENSEMRQFHDHTLDPLVADFFEKCPLVGEAIHVLLHYINYEFAASQFESIAEVFGAGVGNSNDGNGSQTGGSNNAPMTHSQGAQMRMAEALQYEIAPEFVNFLSSRHGLAFVATNVRRVVDGRYRFLRDMFLFQFMLSKFRMRLKSEDMPKIVLIEVTYIPRTAQLLFAIDYLNWACQTPMVTANVAWAFSTVGGAEGDIDGKKAGMTSIVNVKTSPSSGGNCFGGTLSGGTGKAVLVDNTELLSVLDLREYINLNRMGVVGLESTFYDAYPASSILYFFIQFNGGLLAKRIISYRCAAEQVAGLRPANWATMMSSYMGSVCQLLWPNSPGQFKIAEFLLGIGQFDLLERYVMRLNNWCLTFSCSRFFLKGICHLVTGQAPKAIRQFKQALIGINQYDPFLFRIFAQKPPRLPRSEGDDQQQHSQRLPNARTIFRYYNKLVQLFNRYSSPDQVIELVEVALSTLACEVDTEYEEHRSSFLLTLFANHLKMGNVPRAYDVMIENADEDQRRTCLRQFILNLCERGALSELVEFSYYGLENEFVSILESKAKSSVVVANCGVNKLGDVLDKEPINYYHILYAYFIRINEYQRAAQMMYDYYRRLVPETEANNCGVMLERQARALLVAQNCLRLVTKEDALVVAKASSCGSEKRKLEGGSDQYMEMEEAEALIDGERLLSEYELINARLRLHQHGAREYAIVATPLTPDETVVLCTGACQYEQAFRLVKRFGLRLEPIFEGMAAKYVHLLHGAYNRQRIDDNLLASLASMKLGNVDGEEEKKFIENPATIHDEMVDVLDMFYENGSGDSKRAFISYSSLSIADRMWHLIMAYLRQYEVAPRKDSRLIRTVAEKLLSSGVMLPPALANVYQRSNCPEFLRLLISYNFLENATDLAVDYMMAMMGHCTDYFDLTHYLTPNCPPLYMPLHIFDCLIEILAEETEHAKLEGRTTGGYFVGKSSDDGIRSLEEEEIQQQSDEKIDYQKLYLKATKTRKQLQDSIVSNSRVY